MHTFKVHTNAQRTLYRTRKVSKVKVVLRYGKVEHKVSTRSTVTDPTSVDLVAPWKTGGFVHWSVIVDGFKGGHEVTGEVGEEGVDILGRLGARLDVR